MKYRSAVALLLIPATACCAGGLLNALPPDGTWAEYRAVAIAGFSYTVRISSVGELTRNGVACRWIETKLDRGKGRSKIGPMVWKFLVPVKDLSKGGNPRIDFFEGWLKWPGSPNSIVSFPDPAALDRYEADWGIPIISLFMTPKLDDVNELDTIHLYNEKLGGLASLRSRWGHC